MTAQELWNLYSAKENVNADYESWAYGDDADELARLTLEGIKTATASAFPIYEMEGEALPQEGEYSVILNSLGEAVCIIKTTKVFVVPFDAVDERQAYKEGEGDRSLSYWRHVHRRFFAEEMQSIGKSFDETMPVVCEEFEKVYP